LVAVAVALASLASLAPLVGAAEAPRADARGVARAKVDEGVRLTEQGRYADALRAFEEAYALFPSPKIQFNIALANEELERYAAAFEAMSRFLADPQDAAKAKIARGRKVLEGLAKKVGRIAVASEVAGDEVFVDGQRRGVTPLGAALVVDPGAHAVTVKRGDVQLTENVTVGPGEERSVSPQPSAVAVAPAEPPSPPPAAVPAPAAPAATPASAVLTHQAAAPEPARRRWLLWGAVGGGVVLALVITSLLVFRGTNYPDSGYQVTF